MSPDIIPAFEGVPVEGLTVKVSGSVPLDEALSDKVLRVDDIVNTLSQFKVVGVSHHVDAKTGNLIRTHTLKPVEMSLFPIDPNDPADDGIVRALPVVSGGTGAGPSLNAAVATDVDGDDD